MSGSASTNFDNKVADIIAEFYPPNDVTINQEWTKQPIPEWSGPTDDNELIEKASKSVSAKSIFGSGASFSDLYNKKVDVLREAYPVHNSNTESQYDQSSADMALALHFAYWAGKNCERIYYLMWRSKLVRPKWWEHKDYMMRTILRAVSAQATVYADSKKIEVPETANIPNIDPAENTSFADFKANFISGSLANDHVVDAIILLTTYFDSRLCKYGASFYWWTGRKFEYVDDSLVRRLTGRAMMGNGEKTSQNRVKNVVEAMRDHARVIPALNPPLWVVFFLNGAFDLKTCKLENHNPNNNNAHTLNAEYHAENNCPEFLAFLNSIFISEPSRIDLLQEIIGWLLCRNNFGIEKAIMLIGPPRAGKGVIIRLIKLLLGSGAVPFNLPNLTDNKILSAMRFANVAFDPDAVTPGRINNRPVMGLVKCITSNENTAITLLYTQTPWEGPLNCKLVMASNSNPMLFDDSTATGNRLIPLVFDRSYLGNEDPYLFDRLSGEIEGIASWAIDGLIRLIARGRFELPLSSRDQLESLISEGGYIQDFISECLIIGEHERSTDVALWDAYRRWSINSGREIDKRQYFLKSLEDALRSYGARRAKSVKLNDGKFHRGFYGISVTNEFVAANVTPFPYASK